MVREERSRERVRTVGEAERDLQGRVRRKTREGKRSQFPRISIFWERHIAKNYNDTFRHPARKTESMGLRGQPGCWGMTAEAEVNPLLQATGHTAGTMEPASSRLMWQGDRGRGRQDTHRT